MLITITRTIENNIHKALVETEANALDQAFMKAYGEPKVTAGGLMAYPDPARTPQAVITNDAVLGVEAMAGSRTVYYMRTGAVDLGQIKTGDSITFSGIDVLPAANGTFQVVAVDEINSAIAVAASGITTMDPLAIDVTAGTVVLGAQVEGQAISGFTDNATILVLQLKAGTTLDLSVVTPNVDSVILSGVTPAPGLNGTHLITAVDNVLKTITIASLSLASVPQFKTVVQRGNLTHALTTVQFTAPENEVFIRSGSPFELRISGALDPAAAAKVQAWAYDLRDKIEESTQILKQLPYPYPGTGYPIIETLEVQ